MQFVGRFRLRPRLLLHRTNDGGIELGEVRRLGQIEPASSRDRPRASFLQRRIVEKGVRPGVQNFLRHRRGFPEIFRDKAYLLIFNAREQALEAFDVHRFREAVMYRLLHERVIGHFTVPGYVLQTGQLIRENERDEILRIHALKLGRDALAVAAPQERERTRGVPSPSGFEHRRIEQGLHQDGPDGFRMEVRIDLVEWKAVRGAQRHHDGVFIGGGLQFEIELAAEPFSQRQTPRAVDPAAVRRMDDKVHVAGFVEEPLHDKLVLCGYRAEGDL